MIGDEVELVSMQVNSEVFGRPDGGQTFSFGCAVVHFGWIQHTAGIRNNMFVSLTTLLSEHSSQPYIGSVGVENKRTVEPWICQDWSRDQRILQASEGGLLRLLPLERGILSGEVIKGSGFF